MHAARRRLRSSRQSRRGGSASYSAVRHRRVRTAGQPTHSSRRLVRAWGGDRRGAHNRSSLRTRIDVAVSGGDASGRGRPFAGAGSFLRPVAPAAAVANGALYQFIAYLLVSPSFTFTGTHAPEYAVNAAYLTFNRNTCPICNRPDAFQLGGTPPYRRL